MDQKVNPTLEIELINEFFAGHGFKNVYDFMMLAKKGKIVISNLEKEIPSSWFYQNIVNFFGNEHQIKKSIEELLELSLNLTMIISKNLDNNKERIGIIEEMAHVLMVFESLKIVFNIKENELNKEIESKKEILKKQFPFLSEVY